MHILCTRVTYFYCVPINGLSLLKCLSRRFRKYLPMLMLVSLQIGGLNQITLLFFPHLFEWLLLVSPTLMSVQVPLLLLLPLEPGSTGFTYSSLPWNLLFLKASSYILLLSSKILLYKDTLLILWFTALGICLNYDLGWLVNIYIGGGGIVLTKRFEGAVI